jgi:hypothetical protein
MPEDGEFAEFTDAQIDNIQNFIPAARLGKVVNAGKSMFGDAMNKLFASSKLKANQLANRGTVGNVVTGTSRTAANTGLRPAITQKAADKYANMASNVARNNATNVAAGTTAAAIVGGAINNSIQDRGLKGNRDSEGSLVDLNKIAREDDMAYEQMVDESDMITMYNDTGASQTVTDIPGMVELMEKNGWYLKAEPESTGNQFGYHKEPGQNFWDVDDTDPYWDTHVMGTGDAWSDADLKEVVQELDWSSWFK